MRRPILWLGVLWVASPAVAQTPAPVPAVVGAPVRYEKAIEWTRQFIRDTMRVLGAPGASITVIKDGHVIWSEGFGMADLEQQVPATPLTRTANCSPAPDRTNTVPAVHPPDGAQLTMAERPNRTASPSPGSPSRPGTDGSRLTATVGKRSNKAQGPSGHPSRRESISVRRTPLPARDQLVLVTD